MAAWVFFFGGVVLAMLAPLWRRSPKTGPIALMAGALTILGYALFDLAHLDIVRLGQAGIEANRRFDFIALACELPVVALALVSLTRFQKRSFWLGWVINVGFGLWLATIAIWLKFFWHW